MKVLILAGGLGQDLEKKPESDPNQWLVLVDIRFCGIL